jgi:hypothetical protein
MVIGERQREERRWGEGLVCVRNRGERGGECERWGREKKEEGRDVRVRVRKWGKREKKRKEEERGREKRTCGPKEKGKEKKIRGHVSS